MARRKNSVKKAIMKSKFFPIFVAIVFIAVITFFAYGYFVKHLTPVEFIQSFISTDQNNGNGGEGVGSNLFDGQTVQTIKSGEFSVHFLELGNKYTGDCVYVKVGDTDLLIDAGSKTSSIPTIKNYLDTYVTDGTLEFVIATHAHQDHIAGFAGSNTNPSLFTSYECETIIDFPRTESESSVYGKYVAARDAEVELGAKHYTALQCWNQSDGAQRVYSLGEQTTMSILYHKYYEQDAPSENDYSVCVLIAHAGKNYLFTGDLEAEGEESLVESNSLPTVEVLKAGHHGSKTSSSEAFLSVVRPKIVCVCCCAGNDEYTKDEQNQFPTQKFIDRVSVYTDAVYVTSIGDVNFMEEENKSKEYQSFNGTIVILGKSGEDVKVYCSYSTLKLKDSAWFKEKRTTPSAWA